ncbi:MAG: 23S rRNA (guanosine(2251)-2'-O)-methyltransferase RlmB [Firmicutes bacterium]|nr:23S rRNA (guanosine(2251)-2'-O)-methyltransferase RlmB [Bacillota bacterium]
MAERIIGRNAVMEALRTGRQIEKLTVLRQKPGAKAEGSLKKILAKAKDQHIPVDYADRAGLDRMAGGGVHQGVIAAVSDYEYRTVEDLLQTAEQRGEAPFLIILDGLEDPHNLGAIMRTAECAGAHGIIIPERRSVTVNATVMKTSAGAAEHIGCARVTNIARAIGQLQERGVWIYGCDMDGTSCYQTDLTGPAAIVIGNEGIGISRLVREKCDFIISIPMKGRINSLNASNAAAIVTYEALRQRDGTV